MVHMPESTETLRPKTEVLDLSGEISRDSLKPEINIHGEDIGAGVWGEMVARTEQTGKEHGLTVWNGRKAKVSDIIEGREAIIDPETTERISPAVKPSAVGDYFREFLRKKIAYVHTHPLEKDLKNRFSKTDIDTYITGRYKAMVMLDDDGVHLLLGTDNKRGFTASEIAESSYKNVSEATQTSTEVRSAIAESLAPFGIKYYFSSDVNPSPDGVVSLKDVKGV